MAGQDIFPKVAGDILYDTEANRFSAAGRGIIIGSFPAVGSIAGNGIDLGSITINTGSLSNPCLIILESNITKARADPLLIKISGLSANDQFMIGSDGGGAADGGYLTGRFMLGSPFISSLHATPTHTVLKAVPLTPCI